MCSNVIYFSASTGSVSITNCISASNCWQLPMALSHREKGKFIPPVWVNRYFSGQISLIPQIDWRQGYERFRKSLQLLFTLQKLWESATKCQSLPKALLSAFLWYRKLIGGKVMSDLEKVYNANALILSFEKCKKNTSWKESIVLILSLANPTPLFFSDAPLS